MPEIFGTLGPRCSDTETLRAMLEAGMTGVRLNLSHTTLPAAAGQIENLHRAVRSSGKPCRLLIDMQGPELRVGALAEPMKLEEGSAVRLGPGGVPLPAALLPRLEKGRSLLLDDGKLLLELESADTAFVVRGGVLRSRKSVAMPGADVHPPALTGTDRQNLALAAQYGVTDVMQPFVRGHRDLEELRAALDAAGAGHIRVLAKVENQEGLAHLPELIDTCDEIVIARGDLGNAMPLPQLPRVQKQIAAACRRAGRPFMVVTQMLASMEHSPVPTRAEVCDIFNAVCDGAASVMVTGETAVGDYPVEVVRVLAETAKEAERWLAVGA